VSAFGVGRQGAAPLAVDYGFVTGTSGNTDGVDLETRMALMWINSMNVEPDSIPLNLRRMHMTTRMTKHDKTILQRAERMWHEEGCPAGRVDEYRERARELQAIADNPGAGQLLNPMTAHHGEIEPRQSVEEADIMENLGEFPSLVGDDQGNHVQSPMTRRKSRLFLDEA
jgi:hypothetical protein